MVGSGGCFEPSKPVYVLSCPWLSWKYTVWRGCGFLFTCIFYCNFILVQVMFPSTLLGTGENWTLMKTISVTEYLNYEAGWPTIW
jgi:hypothetical protein